MRALINWFQRIARWIGDPREFWLFALVVSAVVGLAFLFPIPLVDGLRYAGLTLQVWGVGTVIRGLRDRGRLFNKPSLVASTRAWIRRFPQYKPRSVTLSASCVGSASAFGSVDAVVWRGYHETDSLEQRFQALAENLETVTKELSRVSTGLERRVGEVRELLQREQTARAEEVSKIHGKLAELGAGGLHIELVGVAWLIAGIVLATVPAEIAQVFQ